MPIHTRPGTWEYCIIKHGRRGMFPCRSRKKRPPRICRRGEPVRQILIDRRTNARVDDKSRRPHFCVCRRHLRENNRMHTASIGTARATLPAGSYLQPAFSAAHLRLVSPTARDLARRPDNSRIGAGSCSLGLVARATSRPSARRHSFRLCHAGCCEAAAVRSCRPPRRRRRATRSRAPHPSAQVPYRPCRSTRSRLPQRVRCSP